MSTLAAESESELRAGARGAGSVCAPGAAALADMRRVEYARLWSCARAVLERHGEVRGSARVRGLDEGEAWELSVLLGRRKPWRAGESATVPLERLDETLRASGWGVSLADMLVAVHARPLRDLRAERASAAAERDALWKDAHSHDAAGDERVRAWLEHIRGSGSLSQRAKGQERGVLLRCLDVLAVLPVEGVELSRLAARVLDDTHALDYAEPAGRWCRQRSRT